jgi:hypothetical protein
MNWRPLFYMRRMSYVAKGLKTDRRMNRRYMHRFIWCLRFGNSKGQDSAPSAPDDLIPWPTVHPMVAFKTYRDAPKLLLQHRMDRHLDVDSAVHPTVIFETYSTALSEKPSAPDHPTGRQYIASVHCLSFLVQRLYWGLWVIGWSDAVAGGDHRFIRRYYFFRKPFPMAGLPC